MSKTNLCEINHCYSFFMSKLHPAHQIAQYHSYARQLKHDWKYTTLHSTEISHVLCIILSNRVDISDIVYENLNSSTFYEVNIMKFLKNLQTSLWARTGTEQMYMTSLQMFSLAHLAEKYPLTTCPYNCFIFLVSVPTKKQFSNEM